MNSSKYNMNPYKIRSQLLMDATDYTGVCNPRQAAIVWALGLQLRNAAMQYTVMTKDYKNSYAKQLSTTTLQGNWVTGMSSPWIDSFKILDENIIDIEKIQISILFTTYTSAGAAESYQAFLKIIKEELFWRIYKIKMNKGLYPYAGFDSVSFS